MKNLKFNNVEYDHVNVGSIIPEELEGKITVNYLEANKCLSNSYYIAKQNNEIKMVEGILMTEFKDGSIESVGHLWNKFADEYFDLSKDLIPHNKEIKSNKYFIAEEYDSNNISTQEITLPGVNMYISKKETHIIFKTNVKEIEIKLKEFLNKKV